MVSRMMAMIAGVAFAVPVQAAGPAPLYTVVRIDSAIDDAEVIGAKRAGALCLPNGAIRWGDIAAGTSMDQRAVVQDVFEDTGVAVTPLGIGGDHAARLRGTVRAATFAMCARHWLGGGARALSGDATMRIEWRLESGSGGPVRTHLSDIARRIDAKHAGSLGALYRLMLVDAARDAAGWLKAD